ncbi:MULTISPECIES: hypothetical protein [unclassified Pseudomonas]|uniref:hypothetical protein n=1 Tax=unclassified Pseudomonas TaxID=196821 RepID=UPI001C4675FC|nr:MULTISPECIES: hypothetical protein [unclassified Pseudomonas]MBV7515419.1 hypothetical protein [Pseudomonas sp. PDM25]
MSINKPATTTLSLDDNATSQSESATAMSTQSLQNFRGTCTAKFTKDGNEVAPAFDGSRFQISYGSLFPKTISLIHIGDTIDNGRYFDFSIIPARGNGTYPIPLTNSNTRFTYSRHGFNVDEGELTINVDNGNCSGTFSLTVTGNPSGGAYETLNIVEGKFEITAI